MLIYILTNKENGKKYVGQTVLSFKERLDEHLSDVRCGSYFPIHRSIRKYGIDKFDKEIIFETSSLESLNVAETYYIDLYNTLAPAGYNLTTGGGNRRWSDEVKKKMSNTRKGLKRKPHSQETKIKIAKTKIGKIHSEEVKEKMRQSHLGKKQSAETKLKKSIAIKRRIQNGDWNGFKTTR